MRAGLERHIHGRPTRCGARAAQGLDLGMRAAAGLRPAAPDDHLPCPTVMNDHGADRRIGPGAPQPAAPERQRERHEAHVRLIRVRLDHLQCQGPIFSSDDATRLVAPFHDITREHALRSPIC